MIYYISMLYKQNIVQQHKDNASLVTGKQNGSVLAGFNTVMASLLQSHPKYQLNRTCKFSFL